MSLPRFFLHGLYRVHWSLGQLSRVQCIDVKSLLYFSKYWSSFQDTSITWTPLQGGFLSKEYMSARQTPPSRNRDTNPWCVHLCTTDIHPMEMCCTLLPGRWLSKVTFPRQTSGKRGGRYLSKVRTFTRWTLSVPFSLFHFCLRQTSLQVESDYQPSCPHLSWKSFQGDYFSMMDTC